MGVNAELEADVGGDVGGGAPDPLPPAQLGGRSSVLRAARFGLGGALLGVLGTFQHNVVVEIGPWKTAPLGIALVFVAVAAYSLWTRAVAGIGCYFTQAIALFAVSELLTLLGPGGDVLVPSTSRSYAWLIGALIIPLWIAVMPRRWFAGGGGGGGGGAPVRAAYGDAARAGSPFGEAAPAGFFPGDAAPAGAESAASPFAAGAPPLGAPGAELPDAAGAPPFGASGAESPVSAGAPPFGAPGAELPDAAGAPPFGAPGAELPAAAGAPSPSAPAAPPAAAPGVPPGAPPAGAVSPGTG